MTSNIALKVLFLYLTGVVIAGATVPATARSQSDSYVLGEVLVTGERPGPALWQVKSGDNVLWILGGVATLPAHATWRSKQFETLLLESQEVILDGRIFLVPRTKDEKAAAKRAKYIPDGKTLKEIVSPESYARFEAVRNVFAKSDRKIDRLRPQNATTKLTMMALRSLGLAPFRLDKYVSKLAAKAKVKVVRLENTFADYSEYLRAIDKNSTEPCLRVDGLENDGAGYKALANAWSMGDIDELRRLVPLYSVYQKTHAAGKCSIALHDSEQSANETISEHTAKWMAAAEKALASNRSTIAVVPMAELFAPDGYLALLRSRGYEVIEPK